MTYTQPGLSVLTATGTQHPKQSCVLNQLVHHQHLLKRCLLITLYVHDITILWLVIVSLDGQRHLPPLRGMWIQVHGGSNHVCESFSLPPLYHKNFRVVVVPSLPEVLVPSSFAHGMWNTESHQRIIHVQKDELKWLLSKQSGYNGVISIPQLD